MNNTQSAANQPAVSIQLRRSTVVLIAGMIAILAIGTVVAFTIGRSRETTYPVGSPQRAVSDYLRLLQSGQVDEAYLKSDIRGGPDSSGSLSREQFHAQFDSWGSQSHRVTLIRASTHQSEASVTVEISTFSGGTFGTSDQTNQQTFTLERVGRNWIITGPAYLSY